MIPLPMRKHNHSELFADLWWGGLCWPRKGVKNRGGPPALRPPQPQHPEGQLRMGRVEGELAGL